MNVEFHPEAEEEFFGAVDYYETREVNLGVAFAREVQSTILRILDHPSAWPTMEGGLRRCLTRRFPYSILYATIGDTLTVLAVMHLHRRPGYWKTRLPQTPWPAGKPHQEE